MPRGRTEKPNPRKARDEAKAKARAERIKENSPYWTTEFLTDRYQISRRTLRRWGPERGYPDHHRRGKHEVYVKQQCLDWEKKNMPELHTAPEMSDDDKRWHNLYLRRQLEKEEAKLAPPPPPKPRGPRASRAGA
jgi:hypothetical protein